MPRRTAHSISALALGVVLAAAPTAVASAQVGSGSINPAAAPAGSIQAPDGSLMGVPGLSKCTETVGVVVPGGTQTFPGIPSNIPHGGITMPIATMLEARGISTRTVAYDASPFLTRGYADSQRRGTEVVRGAVTKIAEACPSSKLAFVGYSEGAGIASNLVTDIAAGRGPISIDRLSSAAFLANPFNSPRSVQVGTAGPGVTGVLGATDYGKAADRTLNVCAAGDWICNDRAVGAGIKNQIKALSNSSALRGVDPSVDAIGVLSQAPHLIIGAFAHTGGYGGDLAGVVDWVANSHSAPEPEKPAEDPQGGDKGSVPGENADATPTSTSSPAATTSATQPAETTTPSDTATATPSVTPAQ